MRLTFRGVLLPAVAGAMALWLSAPAEAQVQEPDSMAPFYSSQTTYSGAAVWESLEQVGRCEAHRNAAKVAPFLMTTPGTPAEQTAFKGLFGNNVSCLGDMSELRVPRFAIRGALAEGLYKAEGGRDAARAGNSQPVTTTPATGFADCYVRAHPSEVRSLLMTTTVGTKQENAALVTMSPGFAPCLAAGQQMRFTPTILRFAFAQALYFMSHASAAGSPTSSAAAPEQRH